VATVRPECVALVGECVRRALVKSHLTNKQAAALMGIHPVELSIMKTRRGCNAARLVMLGPVFMAHFQYELAKELQDRWGAAHGWTTWAHR
jgi:plasmid maintenance system antidote protein VapI